MVVAKDPVTGALRSATAEEMAALQASVEPKRAGKETALKSERLPNGAVVTRLDHSYDVYSVATKSADGKIQEACVPADRLEATLQAADSGELKAKEISEESKLPLLTTFAGLLAFPHFLSATVTINIPNGDRPA